MWKLLKIVQIEQRAVDLALKHEAKHHATSQLVEKGGCRSGSP
jgi:hypothetical protein